MEKHDKSGKTEHPLLKTGLAETIITPQENLQMRGFARSQVSTGVHDDLHARSIAIEGGDSTSVIMMSLSLCDIPRAFVERIRSEITDKTGIPETNILISCIHTHAGPNVESATGLYRDFLVERSVASAVEAWNSRIPARIGTGFTEVFELGRNRRRLLYGGLHPDPEVGVVKIEDAGGKLMGAFFNYG